MQTTSQAAAPLPANDNHKRPAEFDRLLVAYLPAIRKRVARLSKSGRDDIVSNAVELALRYAHTFNPERAGFYTWMMFHVRTAARDYRVRTGRQWEREFSADDMPPLLASGAQYDTTLLNEVLASASRRNGYAAILAGLGYTAKEIGAMESMHPVYVQSCASRGRAELREFAGVAANDNRKRAA